MIKAAEVAASQISDYLVLGMHHGTKEGNEKIANIINQTFANIADHPIYCIGIRKGRHVLVRIGTDFYRELTSLERDRYGLPQII